ncbi:MAG: DUF4330 domain-containing protein [Oscillospiraceae bacterium]|nr:DUF4330 domain-containing protein [Oscillospiraceae bacterium]
MLDKNGKLFGKINLIDFVIILILIALAVFAAMKIADKGSENANISEVRISFFAEETPDYVANVLEKGTSVLDSAENVNMGTVESFEIGAPIGYDMDANGEVQQVIRQGYNSVTISAVGKGELTEHGVTIDGVLYGVGHTLTIYAGKAKLYLKISGIEAVS